MRKMEESEETRGRGQRKGKERVGEVKRVIIEVVKSRGGSRGEQACGRKTEYSSVGCTGRYKYGSEDIGCYFSVFYHGSLLQWQFLI